MVHGKKNSYAEAVKQRIVHVLPEKERYAVTGQVLRFGAFQDISILAA